MDDLELHLVSSDVVQSVVLCLDVYYVESVISQASDQALLVQPSGFIHQESFILRIV